MRGFLVALVLASTAWLAYKACQGLDTLQQAVHGSRESALILAIAEVESGNNRFAVGKDGEVGILQIRMIMVDECNRILKREEFSSADRWSVDRSIEMFNVYTSFWNAKTGDYSDEGMARRWNGGPAGHMKSSTVKYWQRVCAVMEM